MPIDALPRGSETENSTVVITQRALTDIAGSEVVTHELAQTFAHQHNVIIIVTSYSKEWAERIAAITGVEVITLDDPSLAERLSRENVALAWIHHGIIPETLLQRAAEIPFIFHHMSGWKYEDFPYEYPFQPSIEKKLAARVVFPAPEGIRSMSDSHLLDGIEERFRVFGNPAPSSYAKVIPANRKSLTRLLVVSSHIPDEVTEALECLDNVEVTIIGNRDRRKRNHLFSAADLREVDAVITIGKTVQYALLAGVPVYNYDHFGGPGWLAPQNFEQARSVNFSGRTFGKKTAKQIAEELVIGFESAKIHAAALKTQYAAEFLLDEALANLLADVEPVGVSLTADEINDYLASQRLISKYIADTNGLAESLDITSRYADEATEIMEDRLKMIRQFQSDIRELNQELEHSRVRERELQKEIHDIHEAQNQKTGILAMAPLRVLRRERNNN